MAEHASPEFPLMLLQPTPKVVLNQTTVYQLQYQDEDGDWIPWLMPDQDRDKITRIQAHRLLDPEHRGEKRRVLGQLIINFVDEVEGDADGETTAEELLARNKANTERLMKEDKDGA